MTEMVALDPLAMLLDAARYVEDSKPAWAAAARKAVAEARTTARPDAGCAVKALVWEPYASDGSTYRAKTVVVSYVTWEIDGVGYYSTPERHLGDNVEGGWSAAKAAAQADYEARIRSALLEQPATPDYAARFEACREAAPKGLPYGIIDPDYARFFTDARLACWNYGYALAMHGSFTRDLDLIAMPWTETACDAEKLIQQIEYRTEWKRLPGKECSHREHGRMVWTLTSPKFNCARFVDFSVVPRTLSALPAPAPTAEQVTVEQLARFVERDFDYDHPVRRFVSKDEWKGFARALLSRFHITAKAKEGK